MNTDKRFTKEILLYELALFTGAGGGLLASKLLSWRTVCYVEWDAYAVEVLKARIKDGYLTDAPIWDDCFSFDGTPWAGLVDVITAGFPCQPFSSAGKGLAENDPRNGWPAIKRIIREVRPRFAFLENVPGLIAKPYIRRIFGDLAEIGYDAEWGTLSAAAIGANHKRDRLWIVAYSYKQSGGLQLQPRKESTKTERSGQRMAHTNKSGHQNIRALSKNREPQFSRSCKDVSDSKYDPFLHSQQHNQTDSFFDRVNWWKTEPELGRVVDGMAHRVDRLTALGNGQVPAVARAAWKLLTARIIERSI
jgi:DNA (cytosine-5)-methyltransferase 1